MVDRRVAHLQVYTTTPLRLLQATYDYVTPLYTRFTEPRDLSELTVCVCVRALRGEVEWRVDPVRMYRSALLTTPHPSCLVGLAIYTCQCSNRPTLLVYRHSPPVNH